MQQEQQHQQRNHSQQVGLSRDSMTTQQQTCGPNVPQRRPLAVMWQHTQSQASTSTTPFQEQRQQHQHQPAASPIWRFQSGKPYKATEHQLLHAKKACSDCGRLTVKTRRKSCKGCGSTKFEAFQKQEQPQPSSSRTQAARQNKSTSIDNVLDDDMRKVPSSTNFCLQIDASGQTSRSAFRREKSLGGESPVAGLSQAMARVTFRSIETPVEDDNRQAGSSSAASAVPSRLPTQFPLPVNDADNRAALARVPVSPTFSKSAGKTVEIIERKFQDPESRSPRPKLHGLTIEPSFPSSPLLDLNDSFPTPLALSSMLRFTGVLGKGAYSTVFNGELLASPHRKVAVKCIDKSRSEDRRLELEIDALRRSHHKNIVELIDVKCTNDTVYIVTELVEGGELFDRICDLGSFSERDAAGILRQILEALVFLHAKGIVHRDIKPENILIGDDISDIKIADFGVATVVDICGNRRSTSGAAVSGQLAAGDKITMHNRPSNSNSSSSGYLNQDNLMSRMASACVDENGNIPKPEDAQAMHTRSQSTQSVGPSSNLGASGRSRLHSRCYSLVGSLQYMAPEILSGQGYTCSVDLWSVGVLAHILVAGFPPFDIPSEDDLRRKSRQWWQAGLGVPLFDPDDPIWDSISVDAKRFIQSLMSIDPVERPSAEQALEFPWIQRQTAGRDSSRSRSSSVSSLASSFNSLRSSTSSPTPGVMSSPVGYLETNIGSMGSAGAGFPAEVESLFNNPFGGFQAVDSCKPSPDDLKPEIAKQRQSRLRVMSTDMGKIRDKERQLLEREIIFGEPVIGLESVAENSPSLRNYAQRRRRRRSECYTYVEFPNEVEEPGRHGASALEGHNQHPRHDSMNPTPRKQVKITEDQVIVSPPDSTGSSPSSSPKSSSCPSREQNVQPSSSSAESPPPQRQTRHVRYPSAPLSASATSRTLGRGKRRIANWRRQRQHRH